MPPGRRSGYNDDQQLSFEALWAEPEPARDEQVRPHGDTPLGEDRPGPLPADPGERPGDVLYRAGRAGGDGDPAAPGPAGGSGPGGESYLEKVRRLNMARLQAEERVLAELI